jgi:demethylspheroidene O-methyltransferase
LTLFWRRWRNRLYANSTFQNISAAFPLTRFIARRHSSELFDLVAGFAYSQVLLACVELKLFDVIGQDERSLVDIAAAIGWDQPKTRRLMNAASALGLFDRQGEAYVLGSKGAALLGQPWIMRFIAHHDALYADLENPLAVLKGEGRAGHLSKYWSYTLGGGDDAESYTALMAASQAAVSREVLNAYDFSAHSKVLDVGGGDGSFLRALHARHPSLSLMLFDLPPVIAIARKEASPIGMTFHTGSFLDDALPESADAITLVRIVHDHDDDAVERLLAAAHHALMPGGVLIIAEPLAGDAATARVTEAYFNLYFAAMGQGRTRTPHEIAGFAAKSGFSQPRRHATRLPLITSVMSFQKAHRKM